MRTTVRVDESAHRVLSEVAATEGITMSAALSKAVEAYRKQQFFEQLNASFAALRADAEGWKEEQEEREDWDATLDNGTDKE